jgi:large conductance mechanosensitive channel
MLTGFRKFLLRGNVVELAVAVAIGAAFVAVVSAFGTAFINPLIALIGGNAGSTASFTAGGQEFPYGVLITALVTFVLTAAVIYFLVVVPINRVTQSSKTSPEPVEEMKSCTDCLSKIPAGAQRCAFCTAAQRA